MSHHHIAALVHRYADAVVHRNAEQWSSTWAADATSELDEAAGAGSGRWYVHEHWLRTDDSRGILLAHYDDRYVRIDGQWLFASRELTVHYGGPPDLSAPFLNAWA